MMARLKLIKDYNNECKMTMKIGGKGLITWKRMVSVELSRLVLHSILSSASA